MTTRRRIVIASVIAAVLLVGAGWALAARFDVLGRWNRYQADKERQSVLATFNNTSNATVNIPAATPESVAPVTPAEPKPLPSKVLLKEQFIPQGPLNPGLAHWATHAESCEEAAAIMAMNNVYYRFRHMVGKPSYSEKPARLRMNRLVKPATNKVDFELFSLAVSAVNGCEACVRSHEQVVTQGGLSEDAVHDAVRIAAVVHAAAVSLELPAQSPALVAAG